MNRMMIGTLLLAGLLGCSRGGRDPGAGTDGPGGDAGAAGDLLGTGGEDGGLADLLGTARDLRGPADLAASPDLAAPPDLAGGVLNVIIFSSNTCKNSTMPPSYGVPMGTSFTVNWINRADSSYAVDVSKEDMFNHVPIVLGLGPGMSYHDTVRSWCGKLFTGTFWFRIHTACDDYDMPINCSA